MATGKSGGGSRRHVQQELFRHGGKRKGAGRKPNGPRAGAPHQERPEISGKDALHVVLRVVAAVGNLRRRDMYRAIREATLTTAKREKFRIVHLSIQRTHVHLLVEADTKLALARGMQGFQISAARNINTALGDGCRRRRGKVFCDRYHLVVIASPTQARRALAYVLGNWRKHHEDRGEGTRGWRFDWYSSAPMFAGWQEYGDAPFLWPLPPGYEPLMVFRPRSWLLSEGWKRGGAEISTRDVPSKGR